jgi:hypothetical protein
LRFVIAQDRRLPIRIAFSFVSNKMPSNLNDPTRRFRSFAICLVLLLLIGAAARAEERATALERVSADLRLLASDECEGRGPGTAGRQKAAEYIRDEFARMGLRSGVDDGSYLQPFQMPLDTEVVPGETRLVLQGSDGQPWPLELGKDFQSLAAGGGGKASAPIVFAGYGISAPTWKYDDYAGLDVQGKIVLVIRHEPQQNDDGSVFQGKKTTTHAYVRTKLQAAKKQNAAAVLFVNDPFSTRQSEQDQLTAASGFGTSSLGIPFAHVTQAAVDRMLSQSPLKTGDGRTLTDLASVEAEIDRTGQPVSQSLDGWTAELQCAFRVVQADLANVIGVLDGDGPLAQETIVFGAHYDHLGFGGFGSRRPNERAIHYGADDNASGTAAIIELARRFAARPNRPARRLVFIAFDAEERGLIGSKHYLEQPCFPLADTIAMLNYDMVGRMNDNELTAMGTGTGAEFPALLDQTAEVCGLKLKKTPRVMASGDHFHFYQRGVPALHFFTGLHDDYHTPEDTFDKIKLDGMMQTIDFSERFVDALLAMSERPRLVKTEAKSPGGRGVAYLGITPDYAGNAEGLRVAAVASGSPAEKGGLKVGDIITHFAQNPVADLPALTAGLRANKPGEVVKLTVQRDGEAVTCQVTLGSAPQ